MDEHVAPHALDWENAGEVPAGLYETFAKNNMLIPHLPAPLPVELLKSLGIHELLGGLKVEDFDYFHFAIYINEIRRIGVHGVTSGLATGLAYGLPPLLEYASPELQRRVVPQIMRGEKRICIAITEPDAGSDVANVVTTAKKSSCGKYYIVNGQKKWYDELRINNPFDANTSRITNGLWSHYASMAVRTGGPGAAGLSLLLVPLLDHPGVTMRSITTTGGTTSGTTFIDLEDVKVPVENLIGQVSRCTSVRSTQYLTRPGGQRNEAHNVQL